MDTQTTDNNLLQIFNYQIEQLGGVERTLRIIEHEQTHYPNRNIVPNRAENKTWSKFETLWLMENYKDMPLKQVCDFLNRSIRAIQTKYYMHRIKLRKFKN